MQGGESTWIRRNFFALYFSDSGFFVLFFSGSGFFVLFFFAPFAKPSRSRRLEALSAPSAVKPTNQKWTPSFKVPQTFPSYTFSPCPSENPSPLLSSSPSPPPLKSTPR